MSETLPAPLQESILTLITFNEEEGSLVASQISPDHFDDPYHEIVRRVLDFRNKHQKPPGRVHLDDIFADLIKHKSSERMPLTKRILLDMVSIADELNPGYLVSKVGDFIRQQALGQSLVEATDRFMAGGENMLPEVEEALYRGLAARADTMDAGLFLNDWERGLNRLGEPRDFYRLGIEQFDARGVGPSPTEMMLLLAPKGAGKSWFCIHVGKQCLMQRAKVAHITLENSERITYSRYMQSLFAIGQFPNRFIRADLETKGGGQYAGYSNKWITPKLSLGDEDIKKVIGSKMDKWGPRLDGLVIKKFQAGTLTVSQLNAYLDYLEKIHKFIPNVIIVDYPDLMKVDPANIRASLGEIFVGLRGLADDRKAAMVVASQAGRASLTARVVRSNMAAEDIRKVDTADSVLAYSRTPAEASRNLARLSVEHGRDHPDGFAVVISQSYQTGQYAVDSAYVNDRYWEELDNPRESNND